MMDERKSNNKRIVRGGILAAVAAVVMFAAIFLQPYVSHVMTSASLQDQGTAVFDLPMIDEGFVPQGLDYVTDDESGDSYYLVSGYMTDDSDSLVFMVNVDADGKGYGARKITLQEPDGSACKCHNGGVEMDGSHMFSANEDGVLVFDRKEVESAFLDGSAVKATTLMEFDFMPAFVEIHDGKLYVGEYYRDPEYPTPDLHHMVASDGTMNYACIYVFDADSKSVTGYAQTPSRVYSIPSEVQGMCFSDNGHLLLASSWGLNSSCLREFDVEGLSQWGTYESSDWSAPLYMLDSKCQVNYVNLPLFAEEIEWVNDRLVVNCEAASDKYFVGKLYHANSVYSYNLNDLKVIMLAG